MLSRRILTAAVLLPPLVLMLFYLSSAWVAAAFGLFVGAGAWEWTALMGWRRRWSRIAYTVAVLAVGTTLLVVSRGNELEIFTVAVAGWVVALVELVRLRQVHQGWMYAGVARAAVGFLILVPAWVAAYVLHLADPRSPSVLLFALILVWVADSMAYFAGHFFGHTKLAPAISPGKTVEGVVGGLIGVALVAGFGGTLVWRYQGKILALWIGWSIVTALFSVVGDLLESKFKRVAGVKDSGHLLPGHGGALDRVDALTAALPVFALGWHLWFRPV